MEKETIKIDKRVYDVLSDKIRVEEAKLNSPETKAVIDVIQDNDYYLRSRTIPEMKNEILGEIRERNNYCYACSSRLIYKYENVYGYSYGRRVCPRAGLFNFGNHFKGKLY